MGIRAALARFDAMVEAGEPKSMTAIRFESLALSLQTAGIDDSTGRTRQFQIVVDFASVDDGMGGASNLRRSVSCLLEIRYHERECGGRRELDIMISEDANTLIDVLMSAPASYQPSITGIDGVTEQGTPSRAEFEAGLHVLTLPFSFAYHEVT